MYRPKFFVYRPPNAPWNTGKLHKFTLFRYLSGVHKTETLFHVMIVVIRFLRFLSVQQHNVNEKKL